MAPVCSELVESGVIANRDGRVWAEQARWGQSGRFVCADFTSQRRRPTGCCTEGPEAVGEPRASAVRLGAMRQGGPACAEGWEGEGLGW